MPNQKLTKVEALKMITLVVDDEITPQQRQAFMRFIKKHDDVRRKYESMKKLKSFVQSRCPFKEAPESLKDNVRQLIADEKTSADELQSEIQKIYNSASQQKPSTQRPASTFNKKIVYSAAAVLLVFIMGGVIYYLNDSPDPTPSYRIEQLAYRHYTHNAGKFISTNITTENLTSAEQQISEKYHVNLTVPPMDSSNFKGVVYKNFAPGYKAIMLEYHNPHQHKYIYIYAFNMNNLKDFGKLERSPKAIEICQKTEDFVVEDINGKHVVSWKWGNTWYAAISSHAGKKLASLVKPLHYSSPTVDVRN